MLAEPSGVTDAEPRDALHEAKSCPCARAQLEVPPVATIRGSSHQRYLHANEIERGDRHKSTKRVRRQVGQEGGHRALSAKRLMNAQDVPLGVFEPCCLLRTENAYLLNGLQLWIVIVFESYTPTS